MNRRTKLTDTLVRRLTPGPREYTVRDTLVPTLGVRVHPSGGSSYVHFLDGKKVSLGPAAFKTSEEARAECRVQLSDGVKERMHVPLFRDFAAGPWRDSWTHRCKPATIRWRDWHLKNRLLHEFGGLRLDRITPMMVHRWFDDYSRNAPGNANHCLQTLRQILNHAVACGLASSNPARSIKFNPGRKITHFLSREEIDRLCEVLDRRDRSAKTRASQRQQIDIIRLLLLTAAARTRSSVCAGTRLPEPVSACRIARLDRAPYS